jgi:hypothetical protein
MTRTRTSPACRQRQRSNWSCYPSDQEPPASPAPYCAIRLLCHSFFTSKRLVPSFSQLSKSIEASLRLTCFRGLQVEAAKRKFIALKHHVAAIKLAEAADEDKVPLRALLPCLLLGSGCSLVCGGSRGCTRCDRLMTGVCRCR